MSQHTGGADAVYSVYSEKTKTGLHSKEEGKSPKQGSSQKMKANKSKSHR